MINNIEEYLNNFYKGTKNPSLDAMKYFMEEYNNFQENMKFIHIAGTNGKGSCTEMISNILVKQGYKVGKFMSPHLIEYNERISINGKFISNEEMSDLIEELEPKIKKYNDTRNVNITLFELETTMALLYFYRNNVDFVVLETGLGGLYDCTNIISKPLVSVITSIGYDHMHILGNTLPEIAYQKAGIIKENSNTVFFAQTQDVNEVFIETCNDKNNELHLVNENDIKNYRYDKDFQYFDYKNFKDIKINLKGNKQIQNASICIECIKILNNIGYKVSEENIRKGLSTVIHKGRMEILNKEPLIIFDGAHNEPAIENLQNTVQMYYKNMKKFYIVSVLKRKDYEKMLKLLLEDKNATFILTSGNDIERYASGEELYNVAMKYKCEGQDVLIKTLDEAIKFAMNEKEDVVNFVVGSFYVYGTVVRQLGQS
ncbi:MAG: bifunctional folylpolyglutamate synthase/dihydrofolate synthase [Clostridia bacterium]|jgi:dihydrofolate synthase/folylpolyglutamate synthase|nr:bifunctional folylpolyglutamate synthase/dihydrofolate synthase [Clostridia bacterium]